MPAATPGTRWRRCTRLSIPTLAAASESPTFFTHGSASKTSRDCEPWLQNYSCGVLTYTLKRRVDAWNSRLNGRSSYLKSRNRSLMPSFAVVDIVLVRDDELAVPKAGRQVAAPARR